ncbi:uncharacterized protein I206_101496 [Kwoniella pini CBS 10737]|uniref:Uncharacterized protein n=1 Tax=Kwoniella pini CBS 10737 TaxID=1296096 RepID=A0A1B9HWK7_9TREE|nr:uncharacterized protein I206_06531 [Kwoniella pini CBS 10737]OCF47628.1 hypothetical protein I206_06531 [Kwoniella pini CBS 10737]
MSDTVTKDSNSHNSDEATEALPSPETALNEVEIRANDSTILNQRLGVLRWASRPTDSTDEMLEFQRLELIEATQSSQGSNKDTGSSQGGGN